MGDLGTLQDIIFVWACRMDQTRSLTRKNFDSHLRISYGTLKFSHMFVKGSYAYAH